MGVTVPEGKPEPLAGSSVPREGENHGLAGPAWLSFLGKVEQGGPGAWATGPQSLLKGFVQRSERPAQ